MRFVIHTDDDKMTRAVYCKIKTLQINETYLMTANFAATPKRWSWREGSGT